MPPPASVRTSSPNMHLARPDLRATEGLEGFDYTSPAHRRQMSPRGVVASTPVRFQPMPRNEIAMWKQKVCNIHRILRATVPRSSRFCQSCPSTLCAHNASLMVWEYHMRLSKPGLEIVVCMPPTPVLIIQSFKCATPLLLDKADSNPLHQTSPPNHSIPKSTCHH